MSYQEADPPACSAMSGAVELAIQPKEKDLGEFTVRRVLPARERKMVGPFIFFDHMGPAEFPAGDGIAVRPHPHIGIATVTYLFEGEIIHRDSLGVTQPIQAGAVNLMTAGKGIVHSERAGEDLHEKSTLHGIQSWMALPTGQEEMDPAFYHHSAGELPETIVGGVTVRVILGEAYGRRSPVIQYSPILYLDCRLPKDTTLVMPDSYRELAAYVVSGNVRIDKQDYSGGVMAVTCTDRQVQLQASEDSHVMMIGGDPVGKRHIWWNFVSSSKERIEQAKSDWSTGKFDSVPDETEFIPLPK